MKFPSLSSTLRLLKPIKHSKTNDNASNLPEKNLYDHLEEIISIYDTHTYGHVILAKFHNLSEIHQQLLIVALVEHNMIETLEVILESSYDVNFLIRGQTPLHFAIDHHNLHMVKTFVQHNADLELKDVFKETALSCAVRSGNIEIIQYLLEQGSSVNSQSSDSLSPLTFAVENGNSEAVNILLEYGAQLDRSHLVKTL